ncbi:MAG: hypothetical protein P8M30_15365 [Planctomycetaceae bacterium]|nr:hypothetical protein [Planctomycetaceae bacterium]
MNILNINFEELYQRHLCRHSQFGLNVGHLGSVFAVYFGLCAIVWEITTLFVGYAYPPAYIIVGLVTPYMLVVLFNVPFKVWLSTLAMVAIIVSAAVFLCPLISLLGGLASFTIVLYVVLILAAHKYQNWAHQFYHKERDMAAFKEKYQKGLVLFLLLAVYELPILLNYLVWNKSDWTN